MIIERDKPEIIRVSYYQEYKDENYGSCLWAFFNFDIGNGILSIESDCGNYAYRWAETGEGFLKMCGYLDKHYLLKKLCGNPKRADVDATIEEVTEYLHESELEAPEVEELIDNLKCYLSTSRIYDSLERAKEAVVNWDSDYGVEIDQPWELVVATYSAWEKRIVDIYHDFIEPELRKIVEERSWK